MSLMLKGSGDAPSFRSTHDSDGSIEYGRWFRNSTAGVVLSEVTRASSSS